MMLQRKCACSTHTPSADQCESCRDNPLQRKFVGGGAAFEIPPIVGRVLAEPGQPLDSSTRDFMESRFGSDFSGVRLHTDLAAVRSAGAVGALAYTVGQHIVFGAGQHAPASASGRRLLAHELTHVLQQRAIPGATFQTAAVSSPAGADEREAERAAGVVAGGGHIGPVAAAPSGGVQRAVTITSTPQERLRPGARVCLVHLHGDERNAFEAAFVLHGEFCANLVFLSSTVAARPLRHVRIDGLPRRATFDPNRVFTANGLATAAFEPGGGANVGVHPGDRAAARPVVSRWADQLKAAIARCRRTSSFDASEGDPVVALHNNTTPGALSIESYAPGRSESGATETAAAPLTSAGASAPVANPSRVGGTGARADPDNFLLTTQPGRFHALRTGFNIVLQAHDVQTRAHPGGRSADDGSLSVALRSADYVNIEAQQKPFRGLGDPFFVENAAMGREVLTTLGVPRSCSPPAATNAPTSTPTATSRVQVSTDVPALPRETPAAGGRGCLTFADQAALDVRKARFAAAVAAMPRGEVLEWIVGVRSPAARPAAEATSQRDCMLAALRAAAGRPGSRIAGVPSTPGGRMHASFAHQDLIWDRKFRFRVGGAPFDRITPAARRSCPTLPATDTQWKPAIAVHRACWASLSDDDKQREILQASSAPGISRHHWGSDVDLFSTEPVDWRAGGQFADEYSWLQRNAATFGFLQSFTAASEAAGGYIEERWHWSYYPLAQALLEFARAHQTELETVLHARWPTSSPQFSLVRGRWRDFVFHVSQTPRF